MRRFRKLALLMLLLLAVLSGCKKKKPPVPAPQAEAPTVTAPAETTPPRPEPQPEPAAAPPEPAPSVEPPPAATKPKPKPKKRVTKKVVVPPPKEEPKPPSANGGSSGDLTQLSTEANDETLHKRQNTARLLALANSNLNAVANRTLSDDEQARVQQIRAFMAQSRAADADGDTERAYNLAVKARLLSDTLVRQ